MSELAKKLATKLLVRNKDGNFAEYKEPFATIDCETKDDFKQIQEAIRQYKGWIPIEEELPAAGEYILMSFCNFTLPMIGRYEEDKEGIGNFYIGDDDGADTCISQDLYVNAWMQLPETYRPEVTEGSTVK